jgi:hypothetical protein
MSVATAPMTTELLPSTIARAYEDLADGLQGLATALRRGELVTFVVPLPWEPLPTVWDPAVRVLAEAPDARPARLASSGLVTTMAIEVVKTSLVVLVAYQGLLSLMPAPERPRFAPATGEASPSLTTGLPSVVEAAHAAASGQHREVEVDVDGRSRFTAVP